MSAIPVSITLAPDVLPAGGSTSGTVALDQPASGAAGQNVDLTYIEFPNSVGESLLVNPPPAVNVRSGCRTGKFPVITSAGSSGGTVVIIASEGPAAVATTLSITPAQGQVMRR